MSIFILFQFAQLIVPYHIYHSIVGGAFGLNVFPAFLLHGGLRMNLDFTFAF